MTKPVVTDAMVERAMDQLFLAPPGNVSAARSRVRSALESALTEPEEIPVTEEMERAGVAEYLKFGVPAVIVRTPGERSGVVDIYRAMETVRRKSEKPKCDMGWIYVSGRNYQQRIHARKGEGQNESHFHRRKDDPK